MLFIFIKFKLDVLTKGPAKHSLCFLKYDTIYETVLYEASLFITRRDITCEKPI
jgi:hypothetical protein